MQRLCLTLTMETREEEIIFLQVMLPTPAPEPPAGKLEMTPVANPTAPHEVQRPQAEPRGDQKSQQVSEPFAPEVRHVLRHIL